MPELLAGCGNKRDKLLQPAGGAGWRDLITLDNDPNCGADIEHDLMRLPYPFEDNSLDECHLYHVLEHTGQQGDFRFFFAQWEEFWRILKPDGLFFGIVPSRRSPWAWGDPGHTRILNPEVLTFLDQEEYTKQVGVTALADYRRVYRADFRNTYHQIISPDQHDEQFAFVLQAVKPSRISV